jgi:hypothetical protein
MQRSEKIEQLTRLRALTFLCLGGAFERCSYQNKWIRYKVGNMLRVVARIDEKKDLKESALCAWTRCPHLGVDSRKRF